MARDGVPKYMDLREFRDEGYLQEINRRLLHPLGLALEVTHHADGSVSLSGVWDDRDDPEGTRYEGADLAPKAANVSRLWIEREAARRAALGYMVQPADDRGEA